MVGLIAGTLATFAFAAIIWVPWIAIVVACTAYWRRVPSPLSVWMLVGASGVLATSVLSRVASTVIETTTLWGHQDNLGRVAASYASWNSINAAVTLVLEAVFGLTFAWCLLMTVRTLNASPTSRPQPDGPDESSAY